MSKALRKPAPLDPNTVIDTTEKPPAYIRNVDPAILAKEEEMKKEMIYKIQKRMEKQGKIEKIKLGHE
jgi:hypothetical protein